PRPPVAQLHGGLDAVERRHGDVRDDHVGPVLPGGGHQLPAVGHHAHDLELGLEQAAQPLGEYRVVVGDQDARPGHGLLRASGTRTSTVVPRPGAEVTESLAWMRRTRSSMLDIPSPGCECPSAGSKPTPLSWTRSTRSGPLAPRDTQALSTAACLA